MRRPPLALLLVFALAACGGGTEPTERTERTERPTGNLAATPKRTTAERTTAEPTTTALTACEQNFRTAASLNPMEDTWEDWFPAIRTCSLAEWVAAAERFPYPEYETGLAGDPVFIAENLCSPQGGAHEIAHEAKLCLDVAAP